MTYATSHPAVVSESSAACSSIYPPCLGWTGDSLDVDPPAIHHPFTDMGYEITALPEYKLQFDAITLSFIASRNLKALVYNSMVLAVQVMRADHRLRVKVIAAAAQTDGGDAYERTLAIAVQFVNMTLAIAFYEGIYDTYASRALFGAAVTSAIRKDVAPLFVRPLDLTLGELDIFCLRHRYRLTGWPTKKVKKA